MIIIAHIYIRIIISASFTLCPGLIEQSSCRAIAPTIYQTVITRLHDLINLRVPKCVIARERRRFSIRPNIWRDMTPYDLFRGCSVSAYYPPLPPGSAIWRKIADRVPFTSDRFASTFYTCVIYISPKLSWHDGAHRSTRHDYLMDCVRIRLNTQWLNSYELWANVCVSAHVVKASIKKQRDFIKYRSVFLVITNHFAYSFPPRTHSRFDLSQNAMAQ